MPHPECRAKSWLSTFSSRLVQGNWGHIQAGIPKAARPEVSARRVQPHSPKGSGEGVGLRESRNSPPPCSQIKAPEDFREKTLPSSRDQLENDAQHTQGLAEGVLQMHLKHKPRQFFSPSLRSTKRSPRRSSGIKAGL